MDLTLRHHTGALVGAAINRTVIDGTRIPIVAILIGRARCECNTRCRTCLRTGTAWCFALCVHQSGAPRRTRLFDLNRRAVETGTNLIRALAARASAREAPGTWRGRRRHVVRTAGHDTPPKSWRNHEPASAPVNPLF